MKRKRKASDQPVNTAPRWRPRKRRSSRSAGGDGKELNWVQKDTQVHRETLGGLVAELTDLTEPDFDDCDMARDSLPMPLSRQQSLTAWAPGPPRTDNSSNWERVLRAGGADPPFSVFLSIHGTAGPGVPPGRVSSLHCPSLSYSGHP